ncbi:type II toxin-antitoxin system tRNA(fMet)-specific endonuclease VapC [Endozoicomonas sp. 8E]|uniref:type II toxin-antitoxin system tRNA(fMet)-specific endonuclease VapC n=1 Tax=Endozoicomonas sp. 8E TaxID=3035692 RepID=UPI00293947D3|nr:type II toxin-antitoxin system VapC family toxin [Endozoicomonas sp. 8E]WOG28382.1 type II toxin-antitoxin system VapC family toxin [Endozoicomonas sp. 8E]
MLKFLLDTDISIYVIKRRPAELQSVFNAYDGQIAISSITLSELLHGVEKSANPKKNRDNVESFVSRLEVLEYTPKASAHYGDIRANLEREGLVIGVNDAHIAAHARSEGLIAVTNNVREFERVKGLRVENWLEQKGQ